MSILRMMGWLHLHAANVEDDPTQLNNQLEFRAWIYKTWEQEVNNRVGICNPFNAGDFDARVLWSARWLRRLNPKADDERLQTETYLTAGSTGSFFNQETQPQTAEAANRVISIKRAVRLKGNERVALVFAAGPIIRANDAPIRARVSGALRILVRH